MDHRQVVLDRLAAEALHFVAAGRDEFRLDGPDAARLPHRPVLVLPVDVLAEWVHQQASGGSPLTEDEATGLAALQVVETLTTDHGDGTNLTTVAGFRRAAGGRAEFFADTAPVPAGPAPDGPARWTAER